MKIAAKIQAKLDRLTALERRVQVNADKDAPPDWEEIIALREELIAEFLPLVSQLCAAQIITVCLDVTNINENVFDYDAIFAEPSCVGNNGNIWLSADWEGEGVIHECPACRQKEREPITDEFLEGLTSRPAGKGSVN